MRALVLGIGRFGGGREAALHLVRRGHAVRIADRAPLASLPEAVASLHGRAGVEWHARDDDPALLDGVDLLVVNPAVPPSHPLLVEAVRRGVPQSQEVNLFLETYPGRVVLVTGTKGKSTTADLLHRALLAGGHDVLLGGNIGQSLLALEAEWRAGQIAVLEISSFQLERLDPTRHAVEAAVVVPVTRDHLDRHGTLAAYHAAKAVAAAAARAFVVHDAADAVAATFTTLAARRVTFTAGVPAAGQVGCEDGWITSRLPEDPGPVLHGAALQLLGEFQRTNVMAAFAAAALLGTSRHRAGLGLATAKPLPFRLQLCLQLPGLRIYDNAVSTESSSTLAAVRSVPGPVHWVGGGKSKDDAFAAMAEGLVPHLASAHLFGAAAGPLGACLRGRVPLTTHERAIDALEAACAAAVAAAWVTPAALAAGTATKDPAANATNATSGRRTEGATVLFSPGFASFDQYANFRARAEEFHAWLREFAARAGGRTGLGMPAATANERRARPSDGPRSSAPTSARSAAEGAGAEAAPLRASSAHGEPSTAE